MRIFSNRHTFEYVCPYEPTFNVNASHPWERVSIANWIKYPNDHTPHVVHVDYLSRNVDPHTGILHTERLLTCRQNVPAFISRLFGGDDSSLFYEQSQVDPTGRSIVLRSRNLTFCNLITVEETCRYEPLPGDPSRTSFRQEAAIRSVTGWAHIRNAIEEFCVSRFGANAVKGRLALEHAIEKIYAETREQVLETLHLLNTDHSKTATATPSIEHQDLS